LKNDRESNQTGEERFKPPKGGSFGRWYVSSKGRGIGGSQKKKKNKSPNLGGMKIAEQNEGMDRQKSNRGDGFSHPESVS